MKAKILFLFVIVFVAMSQQIALCQQKGRLVLENIDAPSMANSILNEPTSQPIAVYLPPSYDLESAKRYPVVYFLPGYEDSIAAYINGYINGYRLEGSMNSNITQGRTKEVIMVIVNGFNVLEGCFFNNSPVTGNWEDFVVNDVVNYIDTKYRTIPKSDSRALLGLSMGGYGAMHLTMRHPSVFSIGIGECAGLTRPDGMMKTSLFDNATIIKRIISIKNKLSQYPRAEAHKIYQDTIKYYKNQGDWVTLFSFAYGSAFAPNTSLNAPYFDYPFTLDNSNNLVKDAAIFKVYEAGFGNLKEKIELYKDSLLKLKGYAIDYGTNDYFKWIPEGSSYYDSLLTANQIPHRTWKNGGGHGDLHKSRTENVELPYCDSILNFDTNNLSNSALIEKFTCTKQASTPIIDAANKKITLSLKAGTNLSSVLPVVFLSPGAKITPSLTKAINLSSGKSTYFVTSENGAVVEEWSVVLDGFTALESEAAIDQSLQIFPNPVIDHFVLSTDGNLISQVEIIDVYGNVVQSNMFDNKEVMMYRDALSPGLYFVKVHINGDYIIRKITLV